MRFSSKAVVRGIMAKYRKRKVWLSRKAATEMHLYYILYPKGLAKACDDLALKQHKVVLGEDFVPERAPKHLRKMSMIEAVKTTLRPILAKEMSNHLSEHSSNDGESDDKLSDEEQKKGVLAKITRNVKGSTV